MAVYYNAMGAVDKSVVIYAVVATSYKDARAGTGLVEHICP
jgi:hypothetical protein